MNVHLWHPWLRVQRFSGSATRLRRRRTCPSSAAWKRAQTAAKRGVGPLPERTRTKTPAEAEAGAGASYTAIPILHRDGNVCNRARIVVGDVERGFEEADRIFEHRFRTGMVHQGYTEPRAAVAAWDSSGQVTVWSNTQLPFEVQNTLAEILQMAPSKIRVVVPGIGGGFGGKLRVGVEHFAAFLARATGRPVK